MRVVARLPLVLAPAALGCATAVSSPSGPGDAEASITSAVVVVERTADATEGSRAEASARFVRVPVGSSVADALRAIGAGLDLPARGTCVGLGVRPEGVASAPVVELVDVGEVSLEASHVETRLTPRLLPDVTDVVSGLVYARTADPSALPSATQYVAHVRGGADVPAFDVTALAPADPATVRIAGEDTPGTLAAAGTSVDFTWTPDTSGDLLYLDVQPGGARCVLDDGTAGEAGHAAIPTSLLDDAGTMVLHRLHRETFQVPGLEKAEVRFDFARSVTYARP
jgi:hypothetical protein